MPLVVSYNNNNIYSGTDDDITLSTTGTNMNGNVIVTINNPDISNTTANLSDVRSGKYMYNRSGKLEEGGLVDGNNDKY